MNRSITQNNMIPELFCSKQKTNFEKFMMREEGLKKVLCSFTIFTQQSFEFINVHVSCSLCFFPLYYQGQ